MPGLKKRMRQVRAEADLRFAPQARQIRQALGDVESEYATSVSVANDTARGAKRAARAARPVVSRAIGSALETTQQGPTPGVAAALGNLGPAAARDSEGARRRLAETLAMTKAELAQRSVDAESGRSSAIRQAAAVRSEGRRTLRGQLQGVASDAGTFAQARAGELGQEAAQRRVARRGQDVQAGQRAADRVSRERIAEADRSARERIAGAKDQGREKATAPRREAAMSALSLAREQAARLKRAGRDRGEIGPLLVEGRESQTVDGDRPGEKIRVPGVKKVDQLWASVALDIEFDGRLSRTNLDRLRKLGYGANMLGIGKYRPGGSDRKEPADYPQSRRRAPVQR
jgi:hypothetical protein